LLVLAIIGLALRELGFKCESGAGVSAAQETFLKYLKWSPCFTTENSR
jgi:hypothetical protein